MAKVIVDTGPFDPADYVRDGAVAALYSSLSSTGNPTLATVLAVLKALGMALKVEWGQRAA